MMDAWIAGGVFVVAYALIASERLDRTLVALLGGLLLIVLGVVDQDEAFAAIDLNVIFLLAGMMVLAGALAQTGFFQWLAVRSVRLSRGDPLRLLIILCVVTAGLSAFLDNVTTVVLMTPVTLSVARSLGVSAGALPHQPDPGLEHRRHGDPHRRPAQHPHRLGGGSRLRRTSSSTSGRSCWSSSPSSWCTMALVFRGTLQVPDERREAALEATEDSHHHRSRPAHPDAHRGRPDHRSASSPTRALGLEAATIALLGATVLMLVGRLDPHEVLREVEWSTLFFFVGLFILVEAVVRVGIVGGIADAIAEATAGHVGPAAMALLWFSAMASAVIDNIPYTATAIPVVHQLVAGGMPPDALWWSLALGACLGGNLTIVGASANVVVANLAARAASPSASASSCATARSWSSCRWSSPASTSGCGT